MLELDEEPNCRDTSSQGEFQNMLCEPFPKCFSLHFVSERRR